MRTFKLRAVPFLLAAALLLPGRMLAQDPESEGVQQGNYRIKQSIEFGGRISDQSGSRALFDSFVHLRSGVRVFEHTLEMRSANHQGLLFDDFSATSFGFGGDPNNVTRLRAYKNRWYNINATFRRDYNYWDYNLLANPLNPSTPVANSPAGFNPVILQSPHRTQLVRRMSDYNLTLMPQSRVRARLGYGRNIVEGPSFTSFHEGTDVLLFQPWKTTLNSYQMGVDFKLLTRTNFSFDQFFHTYKGDTSWVDNFQAFQIAGGIPTGSVDLGLIFNTAANQPCSSPFVAPVPPSTTPTVNPACNGYQVYNRNQRIRTDHPTSQIAFQSNYFRDFDFSGRLNYSSSESDQPLYDEFYTGLVTRTRQRQFGITGPAQVKRVAVTADFAATYHLTEKLRFQGTFHWNDFRLPGAWSFVECSFFGTSMAAAPEIFTPTTPTPATCTPPPFGVAGTPSHTASSPADIIAANVSRLLSQDAKTLTFEVANDFTRRFGGRIGYRFRNREIIHRETEAEDLHFFPSLPNRGACAGQPLLADGSCRVATTGGFAERDVIDEHSALVGIWARPSNEFRVSFDMELFYADQAFTRITPRQFQRYKVRTSYKPKSWGSFSGTVNILEARNNVFQVNHRRHNRSYGFAAALSPYERWAVDFGYDYNDVESNTNICYTLGAGPLPPGSLPCPIVGSSAPIAGISTYTNTAHFGHLDLMFKPVKRITLNVGYAATSTDGNTTFLSPNAPPGTLQLAYHQPSAAISVDLVRGLTWKAGWGYWGYDEKAALDPTGSRNFHSNVVTLALRYSF